MTADDGLQELLVDKQYVMRSADVETADWRWNEARVSSPEI